MADYIDREAMIKQIERRERMLIGDKSISIAALKQFVRNRPAADVVPAIRGHWIPTTRPYMNEYKDCSVCDYRTWYSSDFNYCPNCGAKMEEEDNGRLYRP